MPLPYDTAIALGVQQDGVNFRHCQSRSLMLDRLANPALDKDDRRSFFLNTFMKPPVRNRIAAWQSFLRTGLGLSAEVLLSARLQSRLMVNMAGGVMENAGLCLDRFGVPYIPGSAVKGCARRMAIQNLLEAREANEPSDKLPRLLADIALVFGWAEQDWKTREDIVSKLRPKQDETDEKLAQRCQKHWEGKRSDFAYAVGDQLWREIGVAARKLLPETDHFAGSASFLPAYPSHLPAEDLELDVLTCHHPKYYEGTAAVALDTEEPIPV